MIRNIFGNINAIAQFLYVNQNFDFHIFSSTSPPLHLKAIDNYSIQRINTYNEFIARTIPLEFLSWFYLESKSIVYCVLSYLHQSKCLTLISEIQKNYF